jgi:two-component system, OmpR family, response regulator
VGNRGRRTGLRTNGVGGTVVSGRWYEEIHAMAGDWPFNPRVVLIVEDDPVMAELLTLIVEFAGHMPLVAETWQRALDLAKERRPDLLIAAARLPELDGPTLIGTLRDEIGVDLPTILLTTSPWPDASVAGVSAVLPMPFHIETLEAELTRLLPR